MRANKGVDTGPELKLRSLVHKAGLRYAIDVRPEHEINRRADIVFRSAKVAVFVNGCFWHGCPEHYVIPKTNEQFWSDKVKRNKERDEETKRLLRRRGWRVMILWEHEDFTKYAARIVREVHSRRQP
jgi:DNA mismatch endonuclease (patch repair protein)